MLHQIKPDFRTLLLATSALAFGVSAGGAQAQHAQPANIGGIEEIIVTAQKRAERLQDVPVSVSAMSGDMLEKQRINNADDIVSFVPNLQVTSTVGQGTPIFALRGISMSDYSLNQAGPVATYYDEVYKGNFAILGVAMFDLERVEVLRGPQGTLYGKNTTGGAVNLIARKPGFETEGYLTAGYGNYNRYESTGAVQTGLGDKVAVRMAYSFAHANGWFENLLPGKPNLDAVKEYGLRGSVLLQPSDKFDLTIRASTSLQNPYNYGILAQPGPDGIGAGVYAMFGGHDYFRTGLTDRQLEADYTPRRHNRTYALAATANWHVADGLTVTSVSSWDKGNLFMAEDTDGSPLKVLEIPYYARTRQIAQDLRLTSDFSGRFNFILGGYYNREKVFNSTNFMIYQDVDINGDGVLNYMDCADGLEIGIPACQVKNSFDQTKTSYAVYSDLTFNITDSLTLRGGLRFTHDKGVLANFISQAIGVDNVIVANLIPGSLTDLFATTGEQYKKSNLSGKIGLDYKFANGNMIYASLSRGYRGNSFNAQAFFDPSELSVAKPETLDAVEAGFKTQLLDRRLQLNGAVFWYGYKNQQFIDVDPVTTAQRLVNLDKSRIIGGELELQARPIDTVTISGGVGILNSSIRKGVLQEEDLKGNKLANAPTLSLNGSVDWMAVEAEWGSVNLHADGNYSSSQYFEVFNKDRIKQKAYALFNARASFRTADDKWGLSAWVKNITDKFYYTSRIDVSGFGFDYNHLGNPRTYGLTADVKF
ncbi:TonB-dependent receptor [Govanella unica]|uniref:TonB-dependent receptor n=1 Tax=Govanella unica TaxID=2975056 RepID=A0A9X3Z8N6_9PROT|nr:TonB-dependent receptor [Govania unica]MDA5195049.1 TonB-dependent receptor [Govania unica]